MCLNEKNEAFMEGDKEAFYSKRKELRSKSQRAKTDFKNKVENQFSTGSPPKARDGLYKMIGIVEWTACPL